MAGAVKWFEIRYKNNDAEKDAAPDCDCSFTTERDVTRLRCGMWGWSQSMWWRRGGRNQGNPFETNCRVIEIETESAMRCRWEGDSRLALSSHHINWVRRIWLHTHLRAQLSDNIHLAKSQPEREHTSSSTPTHTHTHISYLLHHHTRGVQRIALTALVVARHISRTQFSTSGLNKKANKNNQSKSFNISPVRTPVACVR